MARVNVEDSFYSDPRFLRLCTAIGDAAKAIGLCVLAWRLAQKFWSIGESLVPIDEFSDGGFMPLLEVGLARREGDCIYVRGTKDQTAWLIQKRAAGKMGGKAKAAKRKLADASGCLAKPSECLAKPSKSNPLTLTPTLTLKEHTYVENQPPGNEPPEQEAKPTKKAIDPVGSQSADADMPAVDLLAIWNANRGDLPAAKMTAQRRAKIKARLKEEPSAAYWEELVKKLAATPFARGQSDSGWIVNFSWLIKNDENHVKASEWKSGQGMSRGQPQVIVNPDVRRRITDLASIKKFVEE